MRPTDATAEIHVQTWCPASEKPAKPPSGGRNWCCTWGACRTGARGGSGPGLLGSLPGATTHLETSLSFGLLLCRRAMRRGPAPSRDPVLSPAHAVMCSGDITKPYPNLWPACCPCRSTACVLPRPPGMARPAAGFPQPRSLSARSVHRLPRMVVRHPGEGHWSRPPSLAVRQETGGYRGSAGGAGLQTTPAGRTGNHTPSPTGVHPGRGRPTDLTGHHVCRGKVDSTPRDRHHVCTAGQTLALVLLHTNGEGGPAVDPAQRLAHALPGGESAKGPQQPNKWNQRLRLSSGLHISTPKHTLLQRKKSQ